MYVYEEQKPWIFTEEGQVVFLKIRDRVDKLLLASGAVSMICAISESVIDPWRGMACIDRLVELREIFEIGNSYSSAGQDRIFIRRKIK